MDKEVARIARTIMLNHTKDMESHGQKDAMMWAIKAIEHAIYSARRDMLSKVFEEIIKSNEQARREALKEAAGTRPSRRKMQKKHNGWYEVGWNDAVVEMDRAIRRLMED